MIELGVPWATLAVKTATVGCSVVPTVELVVLEVDTGFAVGLMAVQMASLGIVLVGLVLLLLT